jgi:hypothetical protein
MFEHSVFWSGEVTYQSARRNPVVENKELPRCYYLEVDSRVTVISELDYLGSNDLSYVNSLNEILRAVNRIL